MPGLQVYAAPDGEYVKYVCEDGKTLRSISEGGGIKFPCPVPTHPERLNDIGMLRMQVNSFPQQNRAAVSLLCLLYSLSLSLSLSLIMC